MQELAPVILFIALYIVLVVAAFLTLIGSWLLIWRYQRGVEAAMHASGFASRSVASPGTAPAAASSVPASAVVAPAEASIASTTPPSPRADADALFERARRAPRQAALASALAGLAFALVLALGFMVAVPDARTPLRFLFT